MVLPAEGDALALALVQGIRDFWSDRQLLQIDRATAHGNDAPRRPMVARCRVDSEAGETGSTASAPERRSELKIVGHGDRG